MIFKTFQSELDGASNKIGFSKRSFAEWGKQVSTSFKESEGVVKSFKNTLKTAFTIPVEKDNSWIKNKLGKIVSKDNIDSYIPELTDKKASDLAQRIREQSVAVANAPDGWEDYFAELKNNNQGYIIDLIKNTDDLSKLTGKDLVEANQQARESAIAHNNTLKQQTLGAKAASVAFNTLSIADNMIAFALITKGIELVVKGFDNWIYRVEKTNEAIEESRSEYENANSEIESMNSELEATKQRISELESKGVLSFTDEAELEKFRQQNDELERNIALQEKKKGNAANKAVNQIQQNKENLFDDFDDAIRDYNKSDSILPVLMMRKLRLQNWKAIRRSRKN